MDDLPRPTLREKMRAALASPASLEARRLAAWVGGLSALAVALLWGYSRAGAGSRTAARVEQTASPLVLSGAQLVTSVGNFTQGKLLYNVLKAGSLSPQQSGAVVETLAKVVDPRSLTAEDKYELVYSTAGDFARLSITRRLERFVVEAAPAGLRSHKEPIPIISKTRVASGTIQDSLWVAMTGSGLDAAIVVEFADIFAWTLDFLTEPRAGDRFSLTWEEGRTAEGKLVSYTITSAIYDGKATGRHNGILFEGSYYDEKGQSLRRAFLHAPLNFRRISSGFSNRRFHPILRTWRPHHGTDFAAPAGTPVVSIGDGAVTFRGRNRGLGNMVEVRHNATYTTSYGHLSRFARGVGAGSHVRQGQVIGYVGSTGLSTGPHLHFQITKNGSLVNFLHLKFPSASSVPAAKMSDFQSKRDTALAELEKLLPASGTP